MRFSENQKIACVVLVVCVLVSVFGLGGIGLARERGKALKVFDQGTDTSLAVRHSMDAYLDSAAESADLMASEAELLLGSAATIDNVRSDAQIVANSTDLNARYEAYVTLKSDVEKLYNASYAAAKDEGAFKNFKLAYNDFWGYDDLLQRDGYHQIARGYNALASGFPGGLTATLTGQGKLNTFGD